MFYQLHFLTHYLRGGGGGVRSKTIKCSEKRNEKQNNKMQWEVIYKIESPSHVKASANICDGKMRSYGLQENLIENLL